MQPFDSLDAVQQYLAQDKDDQNNLSTFARELSTYFLNNQDKFERVSEALDNVLSNQTIDVKFKKVFYYEIYRKYGHQYKEYFEKVKKDHAEIFKHLSSGGNFNIKKNEARNERELIEKYKKDIKKYNQVIDILKHDKIRKKENDENEIKKLIKRIEIVAEKKQQDIIIPKKQEGEDLKITSNNIEFESRSDEKDNELIQRIKKIHFEKEIECLKQYFFREKIENDKSVSEKLEKLHLLQEKKIDEYKDILKEMGESLEENKTDHVIPFSKIIKFIERSVKNQELMNVLTVEDRNNLQKYKEIFSHDKIMNKPFKDHVFSILKDSDHKLHLVFKDVYEKSKQLYIKYQKIWDAYLKKEESLYEDVLSREKELSSYEVAVIVEKLVAKYSQGITNKSVFNIHSEIQSDLQQNANFDIIQRNNSYHVESNEFAVESGFPSSLEISMSLMPKYADARGMKSIPEKEAVLQISFASSEGLIDFITGYIDYCDTQGIECDMFLEQELLSGESEISMLDLGNCSSKEIQQRIEYILLKYPEIDEAIDQFDAKDKEEKKRYLITINSIYQALVSLNNESEVILSNKTRVKVDLHGNVLIKREQDPSFSKLDINAPIQFFRSLKDVMEYTKQMDEISGYKLMENNIHNKELCAYVESIYHDPQKHSNIKPKKSFLNAIKKSKSVVVELNNKIITFYLDKSRTAGKTTHSFQGRIKIGNQEINVFDSEQFAVRNEMLMALNKDKGKYINIKKEVDSDPDVNMKKIDFFEKNFTCLQHLNIKAAESLDLPYSEQIFSAMVENSDGGLTIDLNKKYNINQNTRLKNFLDSISRVYQIYISCAVNGETVFVNKDYSEKFLKQLNYTQRSPSYIAKFLTHGQLPVVDAIEFSEPNVPNLVKFEFENENQAEIFCEMLHQIIKIIYKDDQTILNGLDSFAKKSMISRIKESNMPYYVQQGVNGNWRVNLPAEKPNDMFLVKQILSKYREQVELGLDEHRIIAATAEDMGNGIDFIASKEKNICIFPDKDGKVYHIWAHNQQGRIVLVNIDYYSLENNMLKEALLHYDKLEKEQHRYLVYFIDRLINYQQYSETNLELKRFEDTLEQRLLQMQVAGDLPEESIQLQVTQILKEKQDIKVFQTFEDLVYKDVMDDLDRLLSDLESDGKEDNERLKNSDVEDNFNIMDELDKIAKEAEQDINPSGTIEQVSHLSIQLKNSLSSENASIFSITENTVPPLKFNQPVDDTSSVLDAIATDPNASVYQLVMKIAHSHEKYHIGNEIDEDSTEGCILRETDADPTKKEMFLKIESKPPSGEQPEFRFIFASYTYPEEQVNAMHQLGDGATITFRKGTYTAVRQLCKEAIKQNMVPRIEEQALRWTPDKVKALKQEIFTWQQEFASGELKPSTLSSMKNQENKP